MAVEAHNPWNLWASSSTKIDGAWAADPTLHPVRLK
jgi:hypothetical protein